MIRSPSISSITGSLAAFHDYDLAVDVPAYHIRPTVVVACAYRTIEDKKWRSCMGWIPAASGLWQEMLEKPAFLRKYRRLSDRLANGHDSKKEILNLSLMVSSGTMLHTCTCAR